MMETGIRLVTLSENDLGRVQMFCGHSPTYKHGYEAKVEWMRARLKEGMRYTLLQVNGHNAGMIEYAPAEAAWRGVDAPGYLVVHCFWVIGRNRGHGYGRRLLEACLEDARGTNGVAVVASKTHWLPTPKIFLKNGFELADRAAPSFDLLVRRLNEQAPWPKFIQSTSQMPQGLNLYYSPQCPYFQNAISIVQQAGEQLKVPVNILHVDSAQAARQMPCAYGTLAYYYNGELLAYCPLGTEKLLGLVGPKLAGQTH
jgi:GNAT superfamily N-acetyltransferase